MAVTGALSLLLLIGIARCGHAAEADDGLPYVQVCTPVRNGAPLLPYFLGQLEQVDYPKSRMSVHLATDHNNEDDTAEMLAEWANKARRLYAEVRLDVGPDDRSAYAGETGPFSWPADRHTHLMHLRQSCLRSALAKGTVDYVWILDADVLISEPNTLRLLMAMQQSVVAPVLRAPNSNYSNFWADVDQFGYYRRADDYMPILWRETIGGFVVPMVLSCFLVDLSDPRSARLTFDAAELPYYNGQQEDIFVFAESARREMVDFHALNTHHFGYIFEPMEPADGYRDYADAAISFIAEHMGERRPGFLHSPLVRRRRPEPSKLGLDQIYVINLRRRPERLRRMRTVLGMLGVAYVHWPAVDGQTLNEHQLATRGVRQLPAYEDPYHKRPLKMGEVGCFLSHHAVWSDVIEKGHQYVLVLEDDAKFSRGFSRILEGIVGRLRGDKEFDWDLIYVGGKNVDGDFASNFVDERAHPYIATVGYTYWTIGYLLSASGARKLLAAEPLPKLVALDEYLPIMFDRHPNQEWKGHFPKRDLTAYMVYPWLVQPMLYTHQRGYVTDTEASAVLDVAKMEEPKGDGLGTTLGMAAMKELSHQEL